ncbi:unnamed protein product [Thelazia callipaeda]|uniref:Uncharacterized protein n=1 Tax=Thelazia callipaeda TaxID=103827 RepID=A0A0N5D641_THECL|nr:unnamed protein product [Thelazia callipaeda]
MTDKYKCITTVYEVLLRRSAQFQEYAHKFIERLPVMYEEIQKELKLAVDDLIAALEDQTPIPENLNFHRFFMTFAWGIITLLAYYFTYMQGSTILPLVLNYIIDSSSALLLAYFIIPIISYFNLKAYEEYGRKSRFLLLIAALVQGLLVGFLLSNCSPAVYLPVEAINMIFVTVSSRLLGPKFNNDRQAYFGFINGIGFIFLICVGFFTRQLNKAYLFSAISAVLTSHLVVQVYIRRVLQVTIVKLSPIQECLQSDLRPSYILLMMMTLSIYCQTLIRILFGRYVLKIKKL